MSSKEVPDAPAEAALICEGLRELDIEAQLSAPVSDIGLSSYAVALPDGNSGDVLVWFGNDTSPQRLSGFHTKRVSALCFSEAPDKYLFTASTDGIARWPLQGLGEEESVLTPPAEDVRPDTLIESMDAYPSFLCLDNEQQRLAVGCNRITHLVHAWTGKVLARLEGHGALVTAAAFRSGNVDSIVTIAEDRRFIVYDLAKNCIMYQSCIVSSSPFISMAVEPGGSRCAIGSSDGKVRVYDLATPECRLLHTMTPARAKESTPTTQDDEDAPVVITTEPAWKRAFAAAEEADEDDEPVNEAEHELPIIALRFVSRPRPRPSSADEREASDAVRMSAAGGGQTTSSNEWQDMSVSAPSLLVCSPQSILELSMHNFEIASGIWTQSDQVPPALAPSLPPAHAIPLGTLGACAIHALVPSEIRVVACSAFLPQVWDLSVRSLRSIADSDASAQAAFTSSSDSPHLLSVFPARRPPPGSALEERHATKPPSQSSTKPGQKRVTLDQITRNSGVAKDQPVVFRATVKSSGYGPPPPKPPTSKSSGAAKPDRKSVV